MEIKNLRVKSIELALQLPDNTIHTNNLQNGNFYGANITTNTIKKDTDQLIKDAEKIYNFLINKAQ